ncbi:DUF4192 family protein [Nocardia sp. SYP-A9097]|uniref:DUF4192 domain-containing protein n=1 Tax=Nocardia sp. SYP-A9097 TaxID=2663237 RepID=UPI00129B316F|nr:DUF4192 domain-containing protein [Nocardia sp. SYP-A9097]MRH89666.1 DUF4192 family protein [Nocardia sp. SYP-A9097]
MEAGAVTVPPRTLDRMTTPAEPTPPEPLPADCADPPPEPDPHLRDPGELIAAVPAMLGFVPARSLVITVLRAEPGESGKAAIDVVARMDLDNPGRVATGELLDRVAGVCVRGTAVAVLALIIDDRATTPVERHRGVRSRKHRDLIGALEHRLDAEEVPLAGAWAVRAIAVDLPWWSLLGPARRGTQPDPSTSPVTFKHVLEGRPIRGSRDELIESVAVNAVVRDKMPALLAAATEVAADRLAHAVSRGEPNFYSRAALRIVLTQIASIEAGTLPAIADLAEVAVALRDRTVRDILFGLILGVHADAAETLWLELTRALPDPERAEAAMLLGYAAYARGDGPLAGVALEAALAADESHRMANLLDLGLQTGMHPDRLRRLAEAGREAAADLGVDLRSEHP